MDETLLSTASSYTENYRLQKDFETKKLFGEIEEIEDEVEKRYNRFKNFDIINYPPFDHHYYHPCLPHQSTYCMKKIGSNSCFNQRIKEEWSILDKSTPSWIFIRAYKQRNDLMRAAIEGPVGSPYDHCLFFFDIIFPTDYPSSPPKLHYHSYQVDLNPNLQPDGKVCLTLLEGIRKYMQWSSGKGKWNPNESNILQVLHTIQNQILSLEHNYQFSSNARELEAMKKYEKRAFALTCEKMIRVLRKPLMDFEVLVEGHFRKRAHLVLMKFKENEYHDCKLMMDLFVRLFGVFKRNGAYCEHHADFLQSRKKGIRAADDVMQDVKQEWRILTAINVVKMSVLKCVFNNK